MRRQKGEGQDQGHHRDEGRDGKQDAVIAPSPATSQAHLWQGRACTAVAPELPSAPGPFAGPTGGPDIRLDVCRGEGYFRNPKG